jgi:hypothetical protein
LDDFSPNLNGTTSSPEIIFVQMLYYLQT